MSQVAEFEVRERGKEKSALEGGGDSISNSLTLHLEGPALGRVSLAVSDVQEVSVKCDVAGNILRRLRGRPASLGMQRRV